MIPMTINPGQVAEFEQAGVAVRVDGCFGHRVLVSISTEDAKYILARPQEDDLTMIVQAYLT